MTLRDHKIISNYARYVIEHDRKLLNRNDWKIIGKDLKTTEKLRPFLTRKIIMSNIETANKTITDLLIANGIKPERAFDLYKEAEQIARNKENSGDLIKIADRYTELHDLKPQKVTYTEQRKEIDYSNMLPNKVTKTISTTKNIDNGEKTRVNTNDECENNANNDNDIV